MRYDDDYSWKYEKKDEDINTIYKCNDEPENTPPQKPFLKINKKTTLVVVAIIVFILLCVFLIPTGPNVVGTYYGADFFYDDVTLKTYYLQIILRLDKNKDFKMTLIMPYEANEPSYVLGKYTVNDNTITLITGATQSKIIYKYNASNKSLKTTVNDIVLYKQ